MRQRAWECVGERGNFLLGGLVIVFVLSLLGVALLDVHTAERRLVLQDERQAIAFYTAEAGLQRAWWDLSVVAGFGGATKFQTVVNAGTAPSTPPTSIYANQPFTTTEGLAGGRQVTLAPSYTVTAKAVSADLVTVTSTGSVIQPGGTATATVQAQILRSTTVLPVFGNDSVTLQAGTSPMTDSYNSQACTPAPCAYNALLPGGGRNKGSSGNVVSNGSIDIKGGVTVNGNVTSTTDVPADPSDIDNAGTVNGTATAGGTVVNTGTITGGSISGATLPPIQTPAVSACSSFPAAPSVANPWITVGGAPCVSCYDTSKHDLTVSSVTAVLANGTYCFNQVKVQGGGSVLQVNGLVSMTTNNKFTVSGGAQIDNNNPADPGHPEHAYPGNFQVYSAFTGSGGVTLSGGSGTAMVVYAPSTDITYSGNSDFYGSLIGKSLTAQAKMHFDLSLGLPSSGLNGGIYTFRLKAGSWKKCPPATCS